jgi:NADH dehydrogenase
MLRGEARVPFRYVDKGNLAVIGRGKAVGVFFGRYRVAGWFAWLLWSLVHLLYLAGFRNRFSVALSGRTPTSRTRAARGSSRRRVRWPSDSSAAGNTAGPGLVA